LFPAALRPAGRAAAPVTDNVEQCAARFRIAADAGDGLFKVGILKSRHGSDP